MYRILELINRVFVAALTDRRGVTAIEYGLIASLIAMAILVAVQFFATSLGALYASISTHIATVAA